MKAAQIWEEHKTISRVIWTNLGAHCSLSYRSGRNMELQPHCRWQAIPLNLVVQQQQQLWSDRRLWCLLSLSDPSQRLPLKMTSMGQKPSSYCAWKKKKGLYGVWPTRTDLRLFFKKRLTFQFFFFFMVYSFIYFWAAHTNKIALSTYILDICWLWLEKHQLPIFFYRFLHFSN